MNRTCVFLLVCLLGFPAFTFGQNKTAAKKPLDHASYDEWNSLTATQLSDDGRWLWFASRSGKGEYTLTLRTVDGGKKHNIQRVSTAKFSADSKHAFFLRPPSKEAVKKAKAAKKSVYEMPKNTLEILNITTDKFTKLPRVANYQLPKKAGGWLAYLVYPKDYSAKNKYQDLHLRNLESGAETVYHEVTSYNFSEDGKHLAFITSPKSPKEPGVYLVETANRKLQELTRGKGKYQTLTFSDQGDQLAFFTTRDDAKSKSPAWSVYLWKAGRKGARSVVTPKTNGLPKGWEITTTRSLNFSDSGKRIFLGTRPKPQPTKKSSSKVNVDVWHWKDPYLQPMQIVLARVQKIISYSAVFEEKNNRLLQLATPEIPSVSIPKGGDADIGIAVSNVPYQPLISWDYPSYNDIYLFNLKDNKAKKVLSKLQGSASLSPGNKYLYWWDAARKEWRARSIASGKIIRLSKGIPHPVHNELHDLPSVPKAYGNAGWVDGDKAILIYDRFDIWAVDPESVLPPVCITNGYGRKHHLQLRYKKTGPAKTIDPQKTMLLTAVNEETRASGFYTDKVQGNQQPRKLTLMNENISFKTKADDADVVLVTRSTFQKYPDLWLTDLRFKKFEQISDTNPQQSKYLWGTAERFQWTSLDGEKLNGILYKPENFSPKKTYPMIVYFYERLSSRLHSYFSPAPSRSSINVSFYVSRGYVVFLPDIPYEVGHPGQSCIKAVVPGVTALIDRGFIDRKRIGVQGHSWGGYQVAYLVTKCHLFAAAEAGAPVSNMTSAYGGIRWSTGKSRAFQYEKTQSRLGGTPWNAQQLYIENSPLFWADKIRTPLLMMHNDRDGAVPWYQGIELFVAMRRLGKPCWMLNYNGEQHGLTRNDTKRDWSIRMQQFFDHYLKGAPAPVWLKNGVPAREKGKTLGLELVK